MLEPRFLCIIIIYLYLLLFNSFVAIGGNTFPAFIFGEYESRHTIQANCYLDDGSRLAEGAPCTCADGQSPAEDEYCYIDVIDTVKIDKDQHEYISVKVSTTGPNLSTCGYEGIGHWENSADRLVVHSDRNNNENCSVALIFHEKNAHLVTKTEHTCRNFCGVRARMDGLVFEKVSHEQGK